jgi:hypothetical protein
LDYKFWRGKLGLGWAVKRFENEMKKDRTILAMVKKVRKKLKEQ